jgi:hypothetical protein
VVLAGHAGVRPGNEREAAERAIREIVEQIPVPV